MNWWLRTYHHDGTSATVEGPGTCESIARLGAQRVSEGLFYEQIQWSPGEPVPPTFHPVCDSDGQG
jgi:hypothetical protein